MRNYQCPMCSSVLDTHTVAHGKKARPAPGDLSVCLYCATMLKFNADKELEILKDADFYLLDKADQEVMNELVYNIVNKHK